MSAPLSKPGWKAFPSSNVLPAATALQFKTGDWATEIPLWHPEICIHCLTCWIACPDDCWQVQEGKIKAVNLDYCKGCGICAYECPTKPKAITMQPKQHA